MRRWPALVLAFLLPLHASCIFAKQMWSGTVTYVSDGDTIWVRPEAGGEARKIRMLGIDAPEVCQIGGEMSEEMLKARVSGRAVMVTTYGNDDYGRALGRVYLHGDDVGAAMVSSGYAWSYRYRRNLGPYAKEQKHAQSQGLGIFSNGTAQEPREFRKSHGSCHVKK